MADPSDFAEKLKALVDAYAAQLPGKLEQIEQMWALLPKENWDQNGYETLHRMVHSLTGSGKSYGFSALSDVARSLEIVLKQLVQAKVLPDGEMQHRIDNLLAELRQVSIKQDGSSPLGGTAVAVGRVLPAPRRILIVDNDTGFAEGIRSQLGYFGYDVRVFGSLADFRRALPEIGDAVVVMDIAFPEGNQEGVRVMKEIQQGRDVPVPVIFLSAHDDLEARLEAVRAGGIAYFNKAVNLSSLIDKLDDLTSTQPVAPYRVMIIDDSPAITAFYAVVLEQAGMVTSVVNDPLEVMGPLIEFSPDLILIDMYMPGCDGMELAKVIRQFEAFVSIPIVFLSAEKDIDKQLSAMTLGGDDFLTKPIQPQHLVSSVSSRIRRSLLLRSFMVRDSLTGLLNHTAIKDQLAREVARARRQGTPFSFAMVDIDHFKRVNDTYGHPVGDRVIKSLSRLLKQRLRENDSVGRYGGEEFAVIFSDTDGPTAVKVLDTIRHDFSHLRHLADGTEFSVTFSSGVADGGVFCEVTALSDAADKALYQAKHAGRNRIVLASSPGG